MSENLTRLVTVGGGTGQANLLSELKLLPVEIDALVNMADDGGSSGAIRRELGVHPPGDARQALVALAGNRQEAEEFEFRFKGEGTLGGHTIGNIRLAAYELEEASFVGAIHRASKVLELEPRTRVIPITETLTELIYRSPTGEVTVGQQTICRQVTLNEDPNPEVFLRPIPIITPEAAQAIESADTIIIAPGDLYGSILPALMVEGVNRAINASSAELVVITNILNQPLHTAGFEVHDHLEALSRVIGRQAIDAVVYNQLSKQDRVSRTDYVSHNEAILRAMYGGSKLRAGDYKVEFEPVDDGTDVLRSNVRHDSELLVETIKEFV